MPKTGVAVQMAREFHARGVILLAPYMSIARQAQMTFPFFSAWFLVKDRYDSFNMITDLRIPILMANGGKDDVIPPPEGRQLYALANEPKQFAFIPEAGYTDILQTDLPTGVCNGLAAEPPSAHKVFGPQCKLEDDPRNGHAGR